MGINKNESGKIETEKVEAGKIAIEKDLNRIEEITDEMESGELDLDKSIALFREGAALAKKCQKYLEDTELVVQKVVDGELEEFE